MLPVVLKWWLTYGFGFMHLTVEWMTSVGHCHCCLEFCVWLTLFFERENLLPVLGMWARCGDGQTSPEGTWISSGLTVLIRSRPWSDMATPTLASLADHLVSLESGSLQSGYFTSVNTSCSLEIMEENRGTVSPVNIFWQNASFNTQSSETFISLNTTFFWPIFFRKKKKTFKSPNLNAF